MDEILYLEPDEEITSVIDKLKKTHSKSVGLVIPRNSSLVHSLVNLKLLKKEAERKKKEIALITTDKVGKNIASQVGLLVYEDVHAKRPVNAHAMADLPKGDEVIEVDMSGGEADETPRRKDNEDEPTIRHYSPASVATNESPKTEMTKTKDAQVEEAALPAELPSDTIEDQEDESQSEVMTDSEPATHHAAHQSDETNEDDEPVTHKSEAFTRKSVAAAETSREQAYQPTHTTRGDFRGSSRKRSNRGLIVAFVLFLIVVLASLLGLPQSTVLVTVAAENFEQTNTLTIDKNVTEVDAAKGIIPGRIVEATNSDARRVVATGKKDVGGKAKGTVTLSNAWDGNPMEVAAGTEITSADGKVFVLTDKVTVPGGQATIVSGKIVTTAGKAAVNVAAKESGDSYNIPPTTFTVSASAGERQSKLTGESTKEMSGGFSKQVSVMTQGDIDTAKEAMLSDLTKSVADQMRKDLKDEKLLDDAITSEVSDVTTNPAKADTETDYFDIKVTAKHKALVFNEKTVNDVVNTMLQVEAPKDKELLISDGDEFAISLDKTDYAAGKMTLTSEVKTKVGTKVDMNQLKQGNNGKSQAVIEEKLKTVPNVKAVTVHPFPRWWWQDTSFFTWNNHYKVVYE